MENNNANNNGYKVGDWLEFTYDFGASKGMKGYMKVGEVRTGDDGVEYVDMHNPLDYLTDVDVDRVLGECEARAMDGKYEMYRELKLMFEG